MHQGTYQRENCRLCEHDHLSLAMPMSDSPIGDAYITKDECVIPQKSYPLSLYLCENCHHLQLKYVIDPNLLFTNYIYRTATSHGLVKHFETYASQILEHIPNHQNQLAIEIGSNDGTLLNFFKNQGMRVLGIDPAQTIAAEASSNGIETLPLFFTTALAEKIKQQYGQAQVICANNVFAHVDNMIDIVRGIRTLLAPEGIFVFEASYLVDMFEKNVFDTIYHEHLCYHRIEPLEAFFNKYGLTFFKVERINTKGGSIRGFVKHIASKREIFPIVNELIHLERQMALNRLETYHKFANEIIKVKDQLHEILDKIKATGATIAGYGASPSVTTATYHLGLNKYLDYLLDDNPIKQGRFTPGQHLPIFPSQEAYVKKPDYILILAWQYAEVIMAKHQAYLASGGHFIIPLPSVRVISNADK